MATFSIRSNGHGDENKVDAFYKNNFIKSNSSLPPLGSALSLNLTSELTVSTQGQALAATPANVLSSNISGLIAGYEGNTFSGTTWSDSINSYNTNATRGTPAISAATLNGYSIVEGNTSSGLQFPTGVLPSTFTLFHVARYNGTEGRIFNGIGVNWLDGFWRGNSGVAYHNGWLTPQTDLHGNDWVLSTSQNSLYRSNGTTRGTSGGSASARLSINYGDYAEYSDWQVAEILVFDRTLTATEYQQVEQYLSIKYQLPLNGVIATSWPFGGTYGGTEPTVISYETLSYGNSVAPEINLSKRRKITSITSPTSTSLPESRKRIFSLRDDVPYNIAEIKKIYGGGSKYVVGRTINSEGGQGGGTTIVSGIKQIWY